MALQDDLNTLTEQVNAVKDLADKLAAEAMVVPDPTPGEELLDSVVTALKGYGYEITPPSTATTVPVTDGTEDTVPLTDAVG